MKKTCPTYSRTKQGRFTQNIQRWKILTFVIGMTAIGPILHTTYTHPSDLIPHVVVGEAHAAGTPTPRAGTDISDPLYFEVKNDPIKKAIYMEFGQISLKTAREALEVAKQESNFNPHAKNSTSTATGIFQIVIGTWKGYHCAGDRENAMANITCAAKIYKSNNNWSQWQSKPINL